jgi:hypothetical protein
LFIAAQNAGSRIRRIELRTFAHPPSAMLAVLGDRGLEPSFAHSGSLGGSQGSRADAALRLTSAA